MSTIAFFHPLYLWALGALAVPIVIHLLFRRRTQALDFSSVRFLRSAAVKASRRRRLRQLLLLLTRLALLALIVLLFAQPFDRSDPFQALWSPQARVYCWIDPTVSMEYRVSGTPLWRRARAQTELIDSTLAPAARLLVYSGEQAAFVPREDIPADKLGAPRHGPADLDAVLGAFRAAADGGGRMPVLVLLSDFQEPAAGYLDTLFAADTLDSPVLCVMLGEKEPWNYGLGGAVVRGDRNAVAAVNVRASGRALDTSEVVVRLGTMRAGHGVASCAEAETVTVEMEVSFPPGEPAAGSVRLRADDPFPADNIDYFVGDRAEGRPVLVVGESEASYPVSAALAAVRGRRWREPVTRRPDRVTFGELDSADVVVLSGIREPTRTLQSLLESSGLGEKVIVFSPSTDSVFAGWNNQVFAHVGMDKAELLRAQRPLFPVLPDTLSRLWRRFPRTAERNAAVYTYYRTRTGSALLRLNNGVPLAVTLTDKHGHVWVVLATPLEISRANNLCETGFYVPFIDRLLRYAVELRGAAPETWYAGVPRHNPYYGSRKRARILRADGSFLAQWDMQRTVAFDRPGNYRVQPVGEPSYRVPVVIDPAETALSYRAPTVPEWNRPMVKTVDPARLRDLLHHRRGALALSLAWIALGALVVLEMALWGWGRGEKAERRTQNDER